MIPDNQPFTWEVRLADGTSFVQLHPKHRPDHLTGARKISLVPHISTPAGEKSIHSRHDCEIPTGGRPFFFTVVRGILCANKQTEKTRLWGVGYVMDNMLRGLAVDPGSGAVERITEGIGG